MLVWQRLIRPDSSSLQLDNLPVSGTQGRFGLTDEMDFHTGRLLKGIAMAMLLGVGTQLTIGNGKATLFGRSGRPSSRTPTVLASVWLNATSISSQR